MQYWPTGEDLYTHVLHLLSVHWEVAVLIKSVTFHIHSLTRWLYAWRCTASDILVTTTQCYPQHINTVDEKIKMNASSWFTVREGVGKRYPVAGQFLKGPELVDTVEYGLGPVDQPTAHLLKVTQHSDVTVWLHPGRGHPHHHHLWIRSHQFLLHSQTCRKREHDPPLQNSHSFVSNSLFFFSACGQTNFKSFGHEPHTVL